MKSNCHMERSRFQHFVCKESFLFSNRSHKDPSGCSILAKIKIEVPCDGGPPMQSEYRGSARERWARLLRRALHGLRLPSPLQYLLQWLKPYQSHQRGRVDGLLFRIFRRLVLGKVNTDFCIQSSIFSMFQILEFHSRSSSCLITFAI